MTRLLSMDDLLRIADAATAVFLGINGHRVTTGDDEVVDLVVAVATGQLMDAVAIAERLGAWTHGGP